MLCWLNYESHKCVHKKSNRPWHLVLPYSLEDNPICYTLSPDNSAHHTWDTSNILLGSTNIFNHTFSTHVLPHTTHLSFLTFTPCRSSSHQSLPNSWPTLLVSSLQFLLALQALSFRSLAVVTNTHSVCLSLSRWHYPVSYCNCQTQLIFILHNTFIRVYPLLMILLEVEVSRHWQIVILQPGFQQLQHRNMWRPVTTSVPKNNQAKN